MASSGDINSLLLQRTTTLKDKREREVHIPYKLLQY